MASLEFCSPRRHEDEDIRTADFTYHHEDLEGVEDNSNTQIRIFYCGAGCVFSMFCFRFVIGGLARGEKGEEAGLEGGNFLWAGLAKFLTWRMVRVSRMCLNVGAMGVQSLWCAERLKSDIV